MSERTWVVPADEWAGAVADAAELRAEVERLKVELEQCEREFEAAVKNLNGVVVERDAAIAAERLARKLLESVRAELQNHALLPVMQRRIRAFLAPASGTPEPADPPACEHEYGTTGATIYCTHCPLEWDLLDLMATSPRPRAATTPETGKGPR